ncbi:MAG: GTP cyclohydrolase I FolE [bacterium]
MEDLIHSMLKEMGENPEREGLEKTPKRVAESLKFLTEGYSQDPYKILQDAVFTEEYDEMVLLRDIDIVSLCEHHLLPFFGKCHVAYIPDKKIVGLSKLARVVDVYSRRLQVQERLTGQIANTINEILAPKGVAVVIEALHLCMVIRGVKKQNAHCVTSSMLGLFRSKESTRMEFMELIKK